MSHSDISTEIYTLLHQKQEIGVPNLGIFKTKNQSIVLDRANGILTPKQRFVTDFEENHAVQNASFVEYVAYKRRISYSEAREIVSNFVNLHKNVLNHQAVYFKNIGKLSKDNLGNIIFQPEQHNLSLEQYGLPVLSHVFPIALDKSKTSKPKTMTKPTVSTVTPPKSYVDVFFESSLLKGLVIAIFLLGIITTVTHYNHKMKSENSSTTTVINDEDSEENNNDGSTAGLNSLDGLSAEAIEKAKQLGNEDPDTDEDELFVKETPEGTKEPIIEEAPEQIPDPKPAPKPTTNDEFTLLDNAVYAVIGSYGGLSNARKSKGKAESKGYVGKIEKRPNGHYRVMIELQMSRADAQKELNTTIRKDYEKAWLAK